MVSHEKNMELEVSKQNNQMSLIALCLGFFMVIIDINIVNVALPTMAENLGGDIAWLQWVVDGYTLTFACLLLSAGNLGDRVGAKKAYLYGLILFVLTSIACGIATNFLTLVIFRLLQGIGAAFLVPTSLALINSSYESKAERARAIGVWASAGGFAAASGPVIGALLTAQFGWRAVFLINIPVGIIAILLTVKHVKSIINSDHPNGFDLPGQIIGIISIASLAFSLIEAGRLGWSSAIVISGLSIFLLTFIIFVIIEYRTSSPMFPLIFFKSKTFSAAIAVGMVINLGTYGVQFLLPLYFQHVRGYSVLMTGLAITPLSALSAIASYFAGRLVSVTSPKTVMVIGLSIGAVGFLTMLVSGEHTPYIMLLPSLLIIGVGVSLTMPAATVAIINSVPEGRAGIASGAFNTSRQIGTLIGVALFGTIISMSVSFVHGMHEALIIAGTLFVLACVATFGLINK